MKTLTTLLVCGSMALSASAQITNGSMTDTILASKTPSGWSTTGRLSPDVNSATTSTYYVPNNPGPWNTSYVSLPGASSDGGTFVGLAAGGNDFFYSAESINQTLSLTAGVQYQVGFEWVNTGINFTDGNGANSYSLDGAIDFSFVAPISSGSGTLLHSTSMASVGDGWASGTFSFIAPSGSETLFIEARANPPGGFDNDEAYLQIDGLRIKGAPEPSSAFLGMFLGLAVVFRRRRRS